MTSDKSYSVESRLNALWNHLGPVAAGGSNGQRQTFMTDTAQTISGTSQVTVGVNGGFPLQWAISRAGRYLLTAKIIYIPSGSVGSAILRIHGAGVTASNLRCDMVNWALQGVQQALISEVTTLDADLQSSTMTSGAVGTFYLDAGMSLSAGPGTLSVDARFSTGASNYVIQPYSQATLESAGQTS